MTVTLVRVNKGVIMKIERKCIFYLQGKLPENEMPPLNVNMLNVTIQLERAFFTYNMVLFVPAGENSFEQKYEWSETSG